MFVSSWKNEVQNPRGALPIRSEGKGGFKYFFGLQNAVYIFGYAIWYTIDASLWFLMRIFDKVSVRLNFSPKYYSAIADKATKSLVLFIMKQ